MIEPLLVVNPTQGYGKIQKAQPKDFFFHEFCYENLLFFYIFITMSDSISNPRDFELKHRKNLENVIFFSFSIDILHMHFVL